MGTMAGVGKSISGSAVLAGREAAEIACAQLGGARPDFCLVFGTSGYPQTELLKSIRGVVGEIPLSGCTGEGVISGPESDERDRAVTVLAVRSETLRFSPLLVPEYSADPVACGRKLADLLKAGGVDDLVGVLLFPDGLLGNCSLLLDTLAAELPKSAPVVGGTAGDAMLFERTWQYCNSEAVSDAVAAVGIRGRGELAFQVSHGCETVGLNRRVTDAEGGWLRQIDGRSAWSVFGEYLDGEPTDLNAEGIAHLSLGEELSPTEKETYGKFIVRTPFQLDSATGALYFPGGGIKAGTPVKIVRRDPGRIRESARACAERITAGRPGRKPVFVLQFDCAGRGRILFGSCAAEEIVRPLQEVLGHSVPWTGFHTYGEIAPIEGRPYYHNYSVALCAIFDLP